jgi:hypothetical protein
MVSPASPLQITVILLNSSVALITRAYALMKAQAHSSAIFLKPATSLQALPVNYQHLG